MRVMHVITRLIQGGAQLNTIACCQAQVAAGHDVTLAFGPIHGPEGSAIDVAEASGATLVEVPTMVRSLRPGTDRACRAALGELIREIKPDLVHTHSSKAGILGRAAAWDQRVPHIVHTIHGLPFHAGNAWYRNRLYVAAERWAAGRCHRLVGLTQAMIDAFGQHRIGTPDQYAVIPSGVDVPEFDADLRTMPLEATRRAVREAIGINPDAKIVGIVARLDPFKGHDDLLNAGPWLRAQHPNLHYLFVGDGFYRKTLETRIGFSSLHNMVTITGLVDQHEVRRFLRAMDVMVLPSYQEGQGRALVEAQLAGCPVVGYDTGGIGEVCRDRETGLLVPTGHWRKLRGAINELLRDPDFAQSLATAGRAHAAEHFSAQRMIELTDQLYADLAASHGEQAA